jgi:hypothetical protein
MIKKIIILVTLLNFSIANANTFDNTDLRYQEAVKALESKKINKAYALFTRLQREYPNNIDLKIKLSIVHFEQKRLVEAEKILREIKRQKLTKQQLITTNIYLEKIDSNYKKHEVSFSSKLSTGHDTNINTGSDEYVNSNGLTVETNKITSSFVGIDATINNLYVVNSRTSFNFISTLQHTSYIENSNYNKTNLIVQASSKHKESNKNYSSGVTILQSFKDEEGYYKYYLANTGFQLLTDKQHSYNAKLSYSQLRYDADTNKKNDTDKTVLSLGYSDIVFNNKVSLSINGSVGKNKVLDSASDNGDSDSNIIKIKLKKKVLKGVITAGVTYQENNYDKINTTATIKRKDKIHNATIDYLQPVDKDLSLILSANYRKNNSNISLYSSDRVITTVSLVRKF